MRSIDTVTGSFSTGGSIGPLTVLEPIEACEPVEPARAAPRRDERSTMRESIRPGHDCTAYPAVRDPEWVESRFGHK